MRVVVPIVVLCVLALVLYAAVRLLFYVLRRPWLYELTIRGFERAPAPTGALLFLGSSTIRFWDTLATDFAPLPVVNRGFGGAVVSQVNAFAARLITPALAPRKIVFYCGANDLAWGVPVAQVAADVARFLSLAKELAPGVPVFVLSVGLAPTRRRTWGRVRALNQRLATITAEAGATFVDTTTPLLDEQGRTRRALYVFDGIHFAPAGYAIWTALLRPLLLAVTLLALFVSHADASPEVRDGPVLGSVLPDSITVIFGLDAAAPAEVEATSPRAPTVRVADPSRVWHELTLTGLEPDTAYDYVVRAEQHEVAHGSFVTAPPDGADVPVRFLVYGDTRDDTETHAAVTRAMAAEAAAFVLHTGDLVADGRDDVQWRAFFASGKSLFATTPLYATLGNHELPDGEGEGLTQVRRWLAMPGANERYYRLDYGPVRVLVLDSNADLAAGTPQRDWLDAELVAARRDAPAHLFALVHAGPLSSGYHGENPALRGNDVERALRAGHVELIFEGHDHAYERGDLRGLKYVVSGGGGAPLYPVNDQHAYQLAFVPEHHYVRVEVRGTKVRVAALTAAGAVLDACAYERGGPWQCVGGRGHGRGRVVSGQRYTAWVPRRVLWLLAAIAGAGIAAWWSRRRRR